MNATRNDTMKNRHETPVTTPQPGCNSLMNGQMRKIMSGRGACIVSICVYFCLLLPPPIAVVVMKEREHDEPVIASINVCNILVCNALRKYFQKIIRVSCSFMFPFVPLARARRPQFANRHQPKTAGSSACHSFTLRASDPVSPQKVSDCVRFVRSAVLSRRLCCARITP